MSEVPIRTYLYRANSEEIMKNMKKIREEHRSISLNSRQTIIAGLAIQSGRIYIRVCCPSREQRFPESVLYLFMSFSVIIFRRQTVGLSFGNDKIYSVESRDTPRDIAILRLLTNS